MLEASSFKNCAPPVPVKSAASAFVPLLQPGSVRIVWWRGIPFVLCLPCASLRAEDGKSLLVGAEPKSSEEAILQWQSPDFSPVTRAARVSLGASKPATYGRFKPAREVSCLEPQLLFSRSVPDWSEATSSRLT